jgi:hypothetical protein
MTSPEDGKCNSFSWSPLVSNHHSIFSLFLIPFFLETKPLYSLFVKSDRSPVVEETERIKMEGWKNSFPDNTNRFEVIQKQYLHYQTPNIFFFSISVPAIEGVVACNN